MTNPPGEAEPDALHKIAHDVIADPPDVPHTPRHTSAKDLAFGEERPSLLDAMGGPLGMIESGVPSAAFVVAITAGADTKPAAIIAVVVAVLFAISRLLRRETIQFAVTGLVGVAISAAVASATGKATTFFLPGFILNIVYGSLALGSVLLRRPFVGYIAEEFANGSPFAAKPAPAASDATAGDTDEPAVDDKPSWRDDPIKMSLYTRASLIWVAIFALRLIIEVPLYLANELVALGTAKIALAYPLWGIGVWLTWLLVRAKPAPAAEHDAVEPLTPDA